jgi:hypothetical protein
MDALKSDRPKRLSIDTRIPEKMETYQVLQEQMKSSFKLKQQQQAIIDSRTSTMLC